MASIRRALFSSNSDTGIRCSSSPESTEMSCKDSISHECEPTADYVDVVVEEKGHGTKKVLVVGKNMAGDICKQLAGMPLLQDIPVVLCSLDNLPSVCNRERFALIFVDKCFGENCITEICTSIRFNSSSPNKTVAIIGVDADQDEELSPASCGLTEVVTLPFKEEAINQLLLQYAGIIPFRGLPLTPESPDDDIAVARKAEEIIRESEEQCLLGYHKESYAHKDSDKMESTFNSADDFGPRVTPGSRHGSGFYTDSSTIPYIRSINSTTLIHNNGITRQSSPYGNPEMRRSSLGSNGDIAREINDTFQDTIYNKQHTSWTITNDQISENLSQNMLPIPTSYIDQLGTNHGSQIFQGQYTNPIACQHGRQPTTSSQLRHSLHFPSPNVQDSRTQQISIPSQLPTLSQNHTTTIPTTTINNQAKLSVDQSAQSTLETTSMMSNKMKASTGSSAYMVSGMPGTKDMKITILPDDLSKHSSKERIRRERIKESCDKLRYLLPNVSGKKTDMASILEMTVRYVKLVNERIPPAVMDEIADSLSASSIVMGRKRTQKEIHVSKQKSMRIIPPVPVSVPSAPLTSGDVNHIIYTAFSNNNGPVYHSHGQHCNTTPHQYNQYIQGLGCTPSYSPLRKDIHHGYIHPSHGINQSITKEIPTIHTHKDTQIYHNYQPIHTTDVSVCPHRQMYGPPLSINTSSSHSDMPQQWSFLKLPSISAISPCSSVCLSSSEDQDTISSSSPNTSFMGRN